MNFLRYITHEIKGYAFIIVGTVLLLHTLDILQQWFKGILILFALTLIIYGFIEARVWQRINELTKRAQKKLSDKTH